MSILDIVSGPASALLGGVGGAIARLVVGVLKARDAANERDHEYRMTDLQLKIDQARSVQAIDLVHAQSNAAGQLAEWSAYGEALRATAIQSGVPFIDAMNAAVRPLLTFWWCLGLYTAYKAILIFMAIAQHASLEQLAATVLTTFDAGIVSTMIGFWFVDRSLGKPGK